MPAVIENQQSAARVTGHQHHPHLWAPLLEFPCEIRAGHAPHPYIAKKQIDGSGKLRFEPERLCGGACRNYREVGFFENLLDELEKRRVVFHKKDSFACFPNG